MDKLSTIVYPIKNEFAEFKELFDSSLVNSNLLLNEVLIHIKQRNGKMMRPILVLLMAKLFGKVTYTAYHSAAALELLHTASLVHDDVVDESSERRGQASVNAIYNNKVSVLVGDYLLATCLVQASLTNNNEIVGIVARLGQDLSEGELLQLSNISNSLISDEVYFNVIRKKTAALFAACTQAAAITAGASKEEIEMAHLFGEYVGICFQIKDDIFDYYDEAEIGKPTGNDMREGKLTLPAIYALNASKDDYYSVVASKVKSGEATTEEIDHLIEYTKEKGGIDYAVKVIYDYKFRAIQLLSNVNDSDVKSSLIAYLDYVIERVK